MVSHIRTTVEVLWNDLVDNRFDEIAFVEAVLLDCGHDASGMTPTDFLNLLNTDTCEPVDELVWCANEVLAYYTSHSLGAAQFVRAVFIAMCAANVIKDGHGHWDFVFDKICILLVQNLDKVDFRFRMDFLTWVLSGWESESGESKQCRS